MVSNILSLRREELMSLQQSHLRSRYRCSFIKSSSIPKIEARARRSSACIDNTGAPLAYSAGGDMSKPMLQCLFSKSEGSPSTPGKLCPPNTLAEMTDKRDANRGRLGSIRRYEARGDTNRVRRVRRIKRGSRTIHGRHDRLHSRAIYVRLQRIASNVTITMRCLISPNN